VEGGHERRLLLVRGCFFPREASTLLVASEISVPEVHDLSIPQELVVEPDGLSAMEDLKVCGAPCIEKSPKELIQMDADEPLDTASPSPWGGFH